MIGILLKLKVVDHRKCDGPFQFSIRCYNAPMKTKWDIVGVADMRDFATALLGELKERENDSGAVILALHGELGAGKTTFTQLLASELGVMEPVTSPTFVIMKLYELSEQIFSKLVHIDAYRIEELNEMQVLGFKELLSEPNTLVCVEWAERITDLLPEHTIDITFTITPEDTREVMIEGL